MAGFYMIATIATKKVEQSLRLRSLSSFQITWFPYHCCHRYVRKKNGFHMIATIAERFFFPAIAAILAIIWKPALKLILKDKVDRYCS